MKQGRGLVGVSPSGPPTRWKPGQEISRDGGMREGMDKAKKYAPSSG